MIVTLLITIITEAIVVLGYSIWRKKPLGPILFTSISANLITQSLLWFALNLFFQYYLITLLIAEVLIWMIESVLLSYFPENQLRFGEAILLSLGMNLASLMSGWLLSI